MILTYSIRHKRDFKDKLQKAKLIADYAVANKTNRKLLTSKYVKHIGLPSAISNQILRKYSQKTIKKATNVNLIAPNQSISYDSVSETVNIKPLKIKFRWNCGRKFTKINQIEITAYKFYLNVTFPDIEQSNIQTDKDMLTIDLNCGMGRSIAVCTDHTSNKTLTFGKNGPNIRKKYFKLRRKYQSLGDFATLKKIKNRESRIMRDLDHKISKQIVKYAKEHKLKIVMENLTGIRRSRRTGNGSERSVNRVVNSWSFYRLQRFIEYKSMCNDYSKLPGIPVEYVAPHYTSQHCNYCGTIGNREGIYFRCVSRACDKHNILQNSDINATYNIRKRSIGSG